MKKKVLFPLVLVSFLLMLGLSIVQILLPQQIAAESQAVCRYSSTQVRVQRNTAEHWTASLGLQCGESFRVGGFHDGTGQLAPDMVFTVVHPDGTRQLVHNEATVAVSKHGVYEVYGETAAQSGWSCSASARVGVNCPQVTPPPVVPGPPTPAPSVPPVASCVHGSTQARVQPDVTTHWQHSLSLEWGQSLNVGSFHNESGQFAFDTQMVVRGTVQGVDGKTMTIERAVSNGERITPVLPGTYELRVTTVGQSGAACEAVASFSVTGSLGHGWRIVN